MGNHQRAKKTKSFFFTPKGLSFSRRLIVICSLAVACATSVKPVPVEIKLEPKTLSKSLPDGDQITFVGSNDSPSWSLLGRKFLFSSKNRPNHKNSQIYEWDLNTSTDRRVTFSDGDCGTAHYLPNENTIIYSSSTDELKERPLLFRPSQANSKELPPLDIYMSHLNGLDIVRLTNRPGFDGDIKLPASPDHEFLFTAEINGVRSPHKIHMQSHSVSPIFSDSKVDRIEYTSLNNRAAWIEGPNLMLAEGGFKNWKIVSLGGANYRDLLWLPGRQKGEEVLLLTAAFPGHPNSQIYLFDPSKNCIANLVGSNSAQLSQPALSPDRRKILYVSDQTGSPQIFMKSIDWAQITCEVISTSN